MMDEEKGKNSGTLQTLFLKVKKIVYFFYKTYISATKATEDKVVTIFFSSNSRHTLANRELPYIAPIKFRFRIVFVALCPEMENRKTTVST